MCSAHLEGAIIFTFSSILISIWSLLFQYEDRTNPMERHVEVMSEISGFEPAPVAAQFFGNAGREHMELYGTKPEHFAKVAHKNHKHSVNNTKAQFQKVKKTWRGDQ